MKNNQAGFNREYKEEPPKFVVYVNEAVKNISFGLYIAFILLGFGQVLFRYVLNRPVTWAEELSRYLFIWSVFLGTALVIYIQDHIALTFFTERLPEMTKRFLELLMNIIAIALVAWLFIFDGYRILKVVTFQSSPAMGIGMNLPYLSIVCGGFLILMNLLWKTFSQIKILYRYRKHNK